MVRLSRFEELVSRLPDWILAIFLIPMFAIGCFDDPDDDDEPDSATR